jgi:hypothetical protein
MTMTAEEALAEVGKVTNCCSNWTRSSTVLSATLHQRLSRLQREISDVMARKEWLFDQMQRMQKAGS